MTGDRDVEPATAGEGGKAEAIVYVSRRKAAERLKYLDVSEGMVKGWLDRDRKRPEGERLFRRNATGQVAFNDVRRAAAERIARDYEGNAKEIDAE